MAKKVSVGAAISLSAIVAAIAVSLTYVYAMDKFNTKIADVNQRQSMYTKLSEIDQKARQEYIGKIDETQLKDGICTGYIAGLSDPNGKYLSAEQYQSYLSGASGRAIGVGVQTVQDEDGNMEVVEVFPNSSAEKSGIKKGDVITAINDKEVVRISYGSAVSMLDGQSGTTVQLTLLRSSETEGEEAEQLKITVSRTEYQRTPLSFSTINGNVMYVAISDFQKETVELFSTVLETLKNEEFAGLVIDLRNNSGGDFEAMSEILDELVPAGNLVVSVDKEGKSTTEYTSDANALSLPISVIINENTYGAAEIFAADIQDYKKGMLVGSKTAGYGTKDKAFALSDGSAIILSTAYYTRVNGETFQDVGISPDIELSLTEEQQELFDRKQLSAQEDSQIQAAVTALFRQGAQIAVMPGSVSDTEESEATSEQDAASSTETASSAQEGSSEQVSAAEEQTSTPAESASTAE